MIMGLLQELLHAIPHVAADVAIALAPVVVVFIIFQLALLRLPKSYIAKMAVGMVYTYIGLVLFFLGIEIGFTDAGAYLGEHIAKMSNNWILIPIGLGIGFSVVLAEPAVSTLVHQVETVSGGTIHRAAIYVSLCISVALAVAMAMIRALWGISFWFFVIPGYLIALVLAQFTSPLFTAIAFDAGGVATGPMTSTFVLSFTVGVTASLEHADSVTDAFGVVALVAMMPLITIQIMGLIYARKARMAEAVLLESNTEQDLVQLLDEEEDNSIYDDILAEAPKSTLDNSEQSDTIGGIQAEANKEDRTDV